MSKFLKEAGSRLLDSSREMKKPATLAITGMLIALSLVIDRATTIVISGTLHVSFVFLTKAVTGMLFGPVVGLYAGALNDIVGYIAYPKGAFFPGYTVSAALAGFLYGLFLYKVRIRWWNAAAAQISVMVLVNLFLNSLWMAITNGEAMWLLLWTRLPKNLMMLPVETALLVAVTTVLRRVAARRPQR